MAGTSSEVFTLFDKIVGYVTPFLAFIVSLIVFIYRAKVKDLQKQINEERKSRKEEIKDLRDLLKEDKAARKKADENLIRAFKEGIIEERGFRTELMAEQSRHIESMCESLAELHTCMAGFIQKLDSHIENQEKICKLNHDK